MAKKYNKISRDLQWNFGIGIGGHCDEGRDAVKSGKYLVNLGRNY
jgi:hypothetical protein